MPLSLEEARRAIEESGADWSAAETSISPFLDHSVDEGSLFGLAISEEQRVSLLNEAETEERSNFLAYAPPPSRIDWRNERGENWVTSIKHQKNCGACIAFSTCATLEARLRIRENDPEMDIDLSEADLFFCGASEGACSTGWHFEPALVHCRDHGIGLESDFPYNPRDQDCQNIPAIVQTPSWLKEVSMRARKRAIAWGGPVMAGMVVYEDFYFYTGGIYRHLVGEEKGLHAVCVIGYDDDGEYWIVKNSYGTNWGDSGFMRIAYGQCGIDTDFPFYDPAVAPTLD